MVSRTVFMMPSLNLSKILKDENEISCWCFHWQTIFFCFYYCLVDSNLTSRTDGDIIDGSISTIIVFSIVFIAVVVTVLRYPYAKITQFQIETCVLFPWLKIDKYKLYLINSFLLIDGEKEGRFQKKQF